MAGFLIGIFFVGLILLCGFITLLILMQRPNANSGMGAALGGGAAEQAFGGETGNVLTRWTTRAIIVFFVICLGLYLGVIAQAEKKETFELPEIAPVDAPTSTDGADGVSADMEAPVSADGDADEILDLREGLLGDSLGNGTDSVGSTGDDASTVATPKAEAEPADSVAVPESLDSSGGETSRMPGS